MTATLDNPFAAPRDDEPGFDAPGLDGMPPEVRRLADAYRRLMRAWGWQALIVGGWFSLVFGWMFLFFWVGAGLRGDGWQWADGALWVLAAAVIVVGGFGYVALIVIIPVAAWKADGFVWFGVAAVLLAFGFGLTMLQDTMRPDLWVDGAFMLVFWFPLYGWPGVLVVAKRAAARLRRAGASPQWFGVEWLDAPAAAAPTGGRPRRAAGRRASSGGEGDV